MMEVHGRTEEVVETRITEVRCVVCGCMSIVLQRERRKARTYAESKGRHVWDQSWSDL